MFEILIVSFGVMGITICGMMLLEDWVADRKKMKRLEAARKWRRLWEE